jgi:hypothetical protein
MDTSVERRTDYITTALFILLLILFCILKIPTLTLPYFWDELGVYARGALYLHDHGLSLFPSALPPELSRGHPLLFTFINGLSFDIFGDSLLTAHCTALFISLLFLTTVFVIAREWFNSIYAFIIVFLLIIQPLFVAQSVMMLPEVTVGLSTWLALYFLIKKKYLFFAITSSIAILIKETAIILPAIAISGILIEHLSLKKKFLPEFLKAFLSILLPLFTYAIFLFIQKKQNGWFLFPIHSDAIHFDLKSVSEEWISYCHFIFLEQGRCYLFLLFLLLHARQLYILSKQKTNILHSTLLFTLFTIAFVLLYFQFIISFFVVSLAGIIYAFFHSIFFRRYPVYFIYVFLYAIIGLVFCSVNFYLNRYIIFLLPALLVLVFYSLEISRRFLLGILIILVALPSALLHMNIRTFQYDEDMGYVNSIQLYQQGMSFLNSKLNGHSVSIYTNFPLFFAYCDPRLGYTIKKDSTDFNLAPFSNRPTHYNYMLLTEPGGPIPHFPGDDSLFVLKVFNSDYGQLTIYKKIK